MSYSDIVKKVSEELNLPIEIVDKTYKAYWFCIKQSIQSLPLQDSLDYNKDQFAKLQTNFNIPSIGKLCTTYDRIQNLKKKYKILKNLKEKRQC